MAHIHNYFSIEINNGWGKLVFSQSAVTSKRRTTDPTTNRRPKNGRQFRCNSTQDLTHLPTRKPTHLKKLKHPTARKKLNFYCHRTFCTFGFAPTHKADPSAKPKEQNFPTALGDCFK